MSAPEKLSIAEIRKYMIDNGSKVTNHALVKHFKRFLTHPQTQNEARQEFKTYVNILATIKNENNQKYLILRKKYANECPSDEVVQRAVAAAATNSVPSSPGGGSIISDSGIMSPFRQPPPYKPPPEVNASATTKPTTTQPALATGLAVQQEHVENYRECVNEFETAVLKIDATRMAKNEKNNAKAVDATDNDMQVENRPKSISRQASAEDAQGNKENIPRFSFSSSASGSSVECAVGEKTATLEADVATNPISVKEATRKFNRMASEEEAKIISPSAKKKPDKQLIEEKNEPEVTLAHPKAKEWIVSMAKANYQELAKLANDFPELVKLQDPSTGYTALHWAAKHGNEDVVKLIAGTYKADVNARTNGGYTPLHLAMQFGRVNIFELLCNGYKANRDLLDWSGNKPLDYSKQRTTVSASTYSRLYDMWNANGGGGGGGKTYSGGMTRNKKRSQIPYATISAGIGGNPVTRTQSLLTPTTSARRQKKITTLSALFGPDEGLAAADISAPIATDITVENNNTIIQTTAKSVDSVQKESSSDSETIGTLPKSSAAKKQKSATTRRKESFLRKTLRAAATANRHNQDFVVTNQTLTE